MQSALGESLAAGMDHRTLTFAHEAAKAADMTDLNHLFEQAVQAHGIEYFVYSLIEGSAPAVAQVVATTYPLHWADHYLSQDYGRVDPAVQGAIATDQPFIWSGERALPEAALLFEEAGRLGIVSGLAVPLPLLGGGKALMALSSPLADSQFQALMRDEASPLLTAAWIYHKTAAQLMDLERVRPEPLSQREIEVLRWLADNLSIEEIAQRLAIPPIAVRSHVEASGRRLGMEECPVARIVAEAARRGYI